MQNQIDENFHFTNDCTKQIKGIAIVLMVCNHLFPILNWIYSGNMYLSIPLGGTTLAALVGGFGKICVSLFAFLSGYGMLYIYQGKGFNKAISKTFKNAFSVLLKYWFLLFALYIPLIYFFSETKMITTSSLLLNAFVISTTYNMPSWYLLVYIEIVLTFPIMYKLFCAAEKRGIKGILIAIYALILVVFHFIGISNFISQYTEYMLIVFFGVYFAKYNILDRAITLVKACKYAALLSLVGGAMIVLLRGVCKSFIGLPLDALYAPMFIVFATAFIAKINWGGISKLLLFLSKYSTWIWFIHGIFFIGNATIQKIAYWPRISALILLWVLSLCLVLSFALNFVESKMWRLFHENKKSANQ